jgi:ABC-type phosphate transport system ATPase subunit
LRGLAAGVDDKTIIQGLDLDLADLRTTVILGPGGSGKSTLLRVLEGAGREAPTNGSKPVRWWRGECEQHVDAVHVMRQLPSERRRLMSHELADAWNLPRDLAGLDAVHSRAVQVWRSVSGAWDQFRPLMSKNCSDLSLGQRRLVELTLTVVNGSSCLLLDEPTAEQTLEEEDLVVRLLNSHRGKRAVILVTHNLRVARRLADDLVLFIGGAVIESGSAQSLFEAPQHPRTEHFLRMGC